MMRRTTNHGGGQQIMETMQALQEDSEETKKQAEEFHQNQERLQGEAKTSRKLMKDTIKFN